MFTSFPAEKTNVYKPSQGTNRKKYLNHNKYKAKMPTLMRNKHVYVHFFAHRQRLFCLSNENVQALFVKVLLPALTQ